jgi:hypothetical protein
MLAKFNTNNLRLFLKGLVTAWVPIAIAAGLDLGGALSASMIMGASTITIDGFFRVFGVGDGPEAPS